MKKQGCEIEARGITYNISINKIRETPFFNIFKHEKHHKKHVLKDVNCKAKPWEILAIVGPSGAGKSSLLEVLAGKKNPQNGSILVNQNSIEKSQFNKISGYVTQKDTLFPLLTVEETLMFSARFRVRLPHPQLKSRVKSLLQELGLDHVATARVGDDRVRGISGGERRRVSIGVEVIHDPQVLILDEPTSGLDSTYALQIIDMLKEMAEKRGRTIILSIHQPGFRIVKLFNSILVMDNGSVLHHGTVDQLGVDLREMGLQLPLHVNVVEFAIESIDAIRQHQAKQQQLTVTTTAEAEEEEGCATRKCTLQQLFQQSKVAADHDHNDDDDETISVVGEVGYANSRLKETIILSERFSKNILRTKELFGCRTIQMLVSGIVLGTIFGNVKDDLKGAEEKVGLFAFILTFLLSCTTEALPIFIQEREILMKETSSGSYRVSSYAIANGIVYMPFLLILAILFAIPLYWIVGLNPKMTAFLNFILIIWLILYTANSVVVCISAMVPNFIIGNSVISGVMGSFFLFSGYFISKKGIPNYWKFMHYISLFKYPFEGLLINEFASSGKCLEFMFGKCMIRAEDVLKEEQGYGYGYGSSKWRNFVIMICFICLYRFFSYVFLTFRCSLSTFTISIIKFKPTCF